MKHHGVMVLGGSAASAWDDLYYLERACEVQCLALATGRVIKPVSTEVAEATARQMRQGETESARLHLASVMRQLDVTEAEYRG